MTHETEFCSCESVSHGDLGSVKDDERLARVVTSPRHYTTKGKLKPGVFPPSHLEKSGLSLLRIDHMTSQEIEKQALAIASQSEHEMPVGILVCGVQSIRSICAPETSARSLCVVDDPVIGDKVLPDNPAHAFLLRTGIQERDEILRIQLELRNLFGDVVPLDLPSA